MLVLTRRPQEQLFIGDAGISITILEIKGGRVRIGITAPPDVSIRREEILDRQPVGCASDAGSLEFELVTH